MSPTDRKAFATLLVALSEYHGKQLSPEVLGIYWEGLAGFEFEDVKRVLNDHLRNPDTGQFMPKVADVVKFLEGNTLTRAMRAWQKVERAFGPVGTYRTVVFDDPLIHAVITDMGGWIELGQIDKDELPFKVREFEKRYQSYLVNPPAAYPRELTGIADQQNAARGYATGVPMLVGDAHKAQLVYQGGADRRLGMTPMKALLP